MIGLFGVGGGSVVVPALTVCMADMTHYRYTTTYDMAQKPHAELIDMGQIIVGRVLEA